MKNIDRKKKFFEEYAKLCKKYNCIIDAITFDLSTELAVKDANDIDLDYYLKQIRID